MDNQRTRISVDGGLTNLEHGVGSIFNQERLATAFGVSPGGVVRGSGHQRGPGTQGPDSADVGAYRGSIQSDQFNLGQSNLLGNGQVNTERADSRGGRFNKEFLPGRGNSTSLHVEIDADQDNSIVSDAAEAEETYWSPGRSQKEQLEELRREVRKLRFKGKEDVVNMRTYIEKLEEANKRLAETQRERDGMNVALDASQIWAGVSGSTVGGLPLKDVVNMVRTFSGEDPHKLEAFLAQCKQAYKLVRVAERSYLLDTILAMKLEGPALQRMKHKKVTSFGMLKEELEALFGRTKSLLEWQIEFGTLRQGENESAQKYAARAEQVTSELISAIQKLFPKAVSDRYSGMEDAISLLARVNFEQGLKGQLQVLVRAAHCKTLHESCLEAVALEKSISTGRGSLEITEEQEEDLTTSQAPVCYNCGELGHLAKECDQGQVKQNKLVLPTPEKRHSIASYKQVCKYCKKPGHEYKTCGQLRKKLGLSEPALDVSSFNIKNEESPSEKEEADESEEDSAAEDALPMGAYRINVVNAEKRRPTTVCFNCGEDGHSAGSCSDLFGEVLN